MKRLVKKIFEDYLITIVTLMFCLLMGQRVLKEEDGLKTILIFLGISISIASYYGVKRMLKNNSNYLKWKKFFEDNSDKKDNIENEQLSKLRKLGAFDELRTPKYLTLATGVAWFDILGNYFIYSLKEEKIILSVNVRVDTENHVFLGDYICNLILDKDFLVLTPLDKETVLYETSKNRLKQVKWKEKPKED